MSNNLKIKVIKKIAVKNHKTPLVEQENQKQGSMRKAFSNVSDWVNEFQQNRREETKQSFERLFLKADKSSGA